MIRSSSVFIVRSARTSASSQITLVRPSPSAYHVSCGALLGAVRSARDRAVPDNGVGTVAEPAREASIGDDGEVMAEVLRWCLPVPMANWTAWSGSCQLWWMAGSGATLFLV